MPHSILWKGRVIDLLTMMETQIIEVISTQGQCEAETYFTLWVLSTKVSPKCPKVSLH